MNMTQREDGQWRALKNDELMRNKMHLGDVYKQELALELTKAGYGRNSDAQRVDRLADE